MRKLIKTKTGYRKVNFKSMKKFKLKYRKGRKIKGVISWIPRKRATRKKQPRSIRRSFKREMTRKVQTVRKLELIDRQLKKIPTVEEIKKLIPGTIVLPYKKTFGKEVSLNEEKMMFYYWLREKGLKDVGLMSRIISVPNKTMKDGIRAFAELYNEKNEYLGLLTVYGIRPMDWKKIFNEVKKGKGERGKKVDMSSPGKLVKVLENTKEKMRSRRLIHSMKWQLADESTRYDVTRAVVTFDFA